MLLNIGDAKQNEGKKYLFKVTFSIPENFFEDRGYKTSDVVAINGEYFYKDSKLYLNAVCSYALLAVCDNCGKEVTKEVFFELNETFVEPFDKRSEDEYVIDRITVSLDKPIIDNLLFSLPARILCKEDCKGLCAICGKDKNVYSCNCEEIEREEKQREQNPFNKLKK